MSRISDLRLYASQGMTDPELARHFKVSVSTIRAWRRAADIPAAKSDREPRHGTVSEYQVHGCRCDECRRANREKGRVDRARRRARAISDDDPRHGDVAFANNWSCPCKKCREAISIYNATRYERGRQRAIGPGAFWTPAEDRIILANRPAVAARFLGRTPKAVRERRRRITRREQEAA